MEEKIIDGVDVAGCEFYFEDNGVIAPDGTPERTNICTSPENSCKNNDSCYCNKNCYYKQLKRLEQENEQLKKENKELTIHPVTAHYDIKRLKEEKEALQSSINLLKKDFEQLEQENEELKARLTPLEDSYFNGLSSIEIAGLAKKSIRITTYNRQLETAIVDIREMLPESKCKYACFSCPESGQCKEEWAKPIKRIITEAIGE